MELFENYGYIDIRTCVYIIYTYTFYTRIFLNHFVPPFRPSRFTPVSRKACLFSVADALRCAQRIGFPVMLKASEGGGGKGIRKSCSKERHLGAGWNQGFQGLIHWEFFLYININIYL